MQKIKVHYNPFSLGEIEKIAPTTYSQREMWATLMLESDSTMAYNEVVRLSLEENTGVSFDVELFKDAFLELITRHDALRSRFSPDGQSLYVRFFDAKYFASFFEKIDLSFFKDPQEELDERVKKLMGTKLSIVNDQLFFLKVFKLSENKYEIIFFAHHIICDGWSYGIVLNEISEIYSAKVQGNFHDLDSPLQFSDYAYIEKENGVDQEAKRYWQKEFFDFVKKEDLPTVKKRSYARQFTSKRIDVKISSDAVVKLKKLCARNGSSFYSGLVTGFSLFMGQVIDLKKLSLGEFDTDYDLVIGLSSATQPALENSRVVGHLVNLLPLRMKRPQKATLKEFLKATKTKMLDAFEHQFFTYGELIKELPQYKRAMGEMPLVSVVFNIDQQPTDQGLKFHELKVHYETVARTHENFEIFVNAVSRDNVLILECQYNIELFDHATIVSWLDKYQDVLKWMVENENTEIENLRLKNLVIPMHDKEEVALQSSVQVKAIDGKIEESKEYETLKKLWCEILSLDMNSEEGALKPDDNFFHLGGHSLLAIDLVVKIERELRQKVEIRDVFEHPTLGMFAQLLKGRQGKENRTKPVSDLVLTHEESEVMDLTFSQYQAWYLEQVEENTTLHHLPGLNFIPRALNRKLIEKTFRILIEVQPMLQVRFASKRGRPVQELVDVETVLKSFQVDYEDYSVDYADPQHEIKLKEQFNKIAQIPFDIAKAPLFRAKLMVNSKLNQSILYFMPHHLIWDGWSFDVFFKEIDQIYNHLEKGNDFKTTADWRKFLGVKEFTYFDFSRLQKEKVKSGDYEQDLDYFRKKYQDNIPKLNLPETKNDLIPDDKKNIATATYFTLDEELIEKCSKFSKEYEISLYVLFLATYKIALSKYCRASYEGNQDQGFIDDFVIGTPVRNRKHEGLMDVCGFFVNTLAIRAQLNYGNNLLDNVRNVRDSFYEALEHDEVPFQLVLNELKKEHKDFDGILFQAFFSFQDVTNRDFVFAGEKYRQINIDKAASHANLDLSIKVGHGKIGCGLEYRPALIDDKIVKYFVLNFKTILNEIVGHPNLSLKDIPLSTEETNDIVGSNGAYFKDIENSTKPFIQLIEKSLQTYGERAAVMFENKILTGEELQKESNKVAQQLIHLGVQNGDLVGICLNRAEDLLIYLLGIMKAGAGYVPLDPKFPVDRLSYMIENSKIDILITESSLTSLKLSVEKVLLKERDFSLDSINKKELEERLNSVKNSDPAYVIYTSGSTGLPKGVEVTHGSVTNFLLGMNEFRYINEGDRLLAVTTLSFDIAVLELYLPLINKGVVVLASALDVIDGKKLISLIEDKKIKVMQATATTWRLLFHSGFVGKKDLTVLCGGEPFPLDLARELTEKVGRVFNMYGPTETTVWSTVSELRYPDMQKKSVVSIGKPILNTSVYILDEYLNILPYGVPGELYIGGAGLARGYFNREDLTRERFIQHPVLKTRLYRTGDVAKLLPNGELICLGRNDGQVKWRGFRIELGEIENKLMGTGLLYEAAVIVFEVSKGDQRLLAFVSAKDKDQSSAGVIEQLKKSLRQNLPHYMIPQTIAVLESLPKTLNGKIDKKNLPIEKMGFARGEAAKEKPLPISDESAPTNVQASIHVDGSEDNNAKEVDQVWKKVLGLENVSDDSNFFDMGGNSLLAVELLSILSEKFQKDLQLRILLSAPKLGDFKELLLEKGKDRAPVVVAGGEKSRSLTHQYNEYQYKTLVEIFKGNTESTPLFVFHGAGGNVLNYISLIPALMAKRSLIAFQSLGLDQNETPHQTILEMARYYYFELKKYRPNGPYLLSGGSMGGIVALEVARLLKLSGDEVYPIIMFDTFGPMFDLKEYESTEKISFFEKIKRSFNYRSKYFMNNLHYQFCLLMGRKVPLKVLVTIMEKVNYQAIWSYKASVYEGDIILIRSKMREKGWYSDPYLGWKKAIKGQIETHEIEGHHNEFIEAPEMIGVLKEILLKTK